MSYLTAIPAYGRDYKSKKELLADWEANKDFLIQGFSGSGYINRDQAQRANVTVNIRYNQLRKVCVCR